MPTNPFTAPVTLQERAVLPNVVGVLLRLVMVGLAIFVVVSAARAVGSNSLASPLDLTLSADSVDSAFPADATISEATALVDVEIGLGYRVAWWLVTDALAVVGLAFLELLRRIMVDIHDPFTERNVSRLNAMVALALGGACLEAVRPVVAIAIQDNAGFEGFEATWGFGGIVFALGLAALLEVWRQGVALRTEAELTI